MTATVTLVGASHPAARALALALESEPEVERVIGVASSEPPVLGPKFEYVRAREGEHLAGQVAGADVVALFPQLDAASRDSGRQGRAALDAAAQVVKGAEANGARALVMWSSGMVYGAHRDNPVPLAETDPVRANPSFPIATQLAEIERIVLGFNGGQGAGVLRAAPVWAPSWGTVFGRWLAAPALLGIRGADPAMQALHPDDAAGALALAVMAPLRGGGATAAAGAAEETTETLDAERAAGPLSGVYNVAPADWLSATELAAVTGRRRVQLPEPVAFSFAERLWALGVADGPPGELHYLMWPWALDASKLRAAGWSPSVTSREALAEAGQADRDGVALGRLTVRREDLYRGVGAAAAGVTLLALARRAATRR